MNEESQPSPSEQAPKRRVILKKVQLKRVQLKKLTKKLERAPEEPIDPAHVPLTEEFDRARWTMPPLQILVIAVVAVGIVLLAVSWTTRAKPGAEGQLTDVTAVSVPENSVMVAINVSLDNPTQKSFWVHNLKARLTTDKGEWSDDAASAVDFDRYFQAFPELKYNALPPLVPETKIAPGGKAKGTIIVSFPVSKDDFEKRKSLAVVVEPYDQPKPVVITK
ncbi:MAG TPA: hypothetical protein VEG30_12945 [Terriglobales bacterium]|nr:hypothetical protein [Terriglobales bacterium]